MRNRLYLACTLGMAMALAFSGLSALAKDKDGSKKEDGEAAVAWEKVPAPVQQGIQAQLGTERPEQITQETDDGFTTYEAAQKVNGQLKEVKLGENGQLLEVEDAVPVSELPYAVKAAIEKEAPEAEIGAVVRVTSYYYEIEVQKGGRAKELKILGNGQEFEEED